MRKRYVFLWLFFLTTTLAAQQTDSAKEAVLEEVRVRTRLDNLDRLPDFEGTHIWSGKKAKC